MTTIKYIISVRDRALATVDDRLLRIAYDLRLPGSNILLSPGPELASQTLQLGTTIQTTCTTIPSQLISICHGRVGEPVRRAPFPSTYPIAAPAYNLNMRGA